MSEITAAYTGTRFCHNPPHMTVVAISESNILLVRHEKTDANGNKQTVLTFPGRDLVFVRGSVQDSEYMYTKDGLNNVGFKISAANILAEAVGPSLETKRVIALTRDQHGLLTPHHETIVCVASVKIDERQLSSDREYTVDQAEILANNLGFEAAQKLHAQRKRSTWCDIASLFKNITRQKDITPFLEPKGSHAFTLTALLGVKPVPISSATVSILDALAKNDPFSNIGHPLDRPFITQEDKKAIAAHFKKIASSPAAGS